MSIGPSSKRLGGPSGPSSIQHTTIRRLPRANAASAGRPEVQVLAETWSGIMEVGFIGLGRMGAGMAANLLKAGHHVTVYNRTRAKAEALVAGGAKVAADVSDACRGAAVFPLLANDEAVENVTLTAGGILDRLAPGAIHISSSTISVGLSERLARAHADAAQRFIAAP